MDIASSSCPNSKPGENVCKLSEFSFLSVKMHLNSEYRPSVIVSLHWYKNPNPIYFMSLHYSCSQIKFNCCFSKFLQSCVRLLIIKPFLIFKKNILMMFNDFSMFLCPS